MNSIAGGAVEHCTGIAKVMCSNPVQSLISKLLNVQQYCDDQSCLDIFLCSSSLWSFIYSLALSLLFDILIDIHVENISFYN